MTNQELKDLIASLAVMQAETSAQMAQTDKKIARMEAGIERVNKRLGAIGENQGNITEEYFYNSLRAKPVLGDIKFDRVTPNLIVGKKGQDSEFDIVMVNGTSVALIEVKQKAHINDLDQVLAQIKKFRALCPEYKNFNLYGGIAGFSVPTDVVNAAHDKGLFVLKRTGDVFMADTKRMHAF
jgi:hypothetical protein